MDDLFFVILEFISEALGEVVIQLLAEALISLGLRMARKIVVNGRTLDTVFAAVFYCLFGLIAGAISVALFPYPIVHPSRFHGISLVISPFCTGLIMSWLGHGLSARGFRREKIETFGYGFAFAFMMMLIRFFFAY